MRIEAQIIAVFVVSGVCLSGSGISAQEDKAAQLAREGLQEFRKGNSARAKDLLTAAVRQDPRQPACQKALGEISLASGETTNAISYFEAALKFDSRDAEL